MKRKSLLDLINVPVPCSQSWDEMTGDDKARHCQTCDKDIHNISDQPDNEDLFEVLRKL